MSSRESGAEGPVGTMFPSSASMENLAGQEGDRRLLSRLATGRWAEGSGEEGEGVGGEAGAGGEGIGDVAGGALGGVGRGLGRVQRSVSDGTLRSATVTTLGLGAEVCAQGAQAIVDDSFTRCFEREEHRPWNFNAYLWPTWVLGVAFRYLFLFPLRFSILLVGALLFFVAFFCVKLLGRVWLSAEGKKALERGLLLFLANVFVMSWSGVILLNGVRPSPAPGEVPGIFLANHTSMADFIVLLAAHPYAVLGQLHTGWVGWMQAYALSSLDCIWFDRGSMANRKLVAQRLQEHARDSTKLPLLIFGEGTCVNNRYMLRLRKFPFELGVPINPIGIKYHQDWSDPYWISKKESFGQYLLRLMCSWAVVADVTFMEPMHKRLDEDAAGFASRVQKRIASKAGLRPVTWDGYMKYWKPSERFLHLRQRSVATQLLKAHHLGEPDSKPKGFKDHSEAAKKDEAGKKAGGEKKKGEGTA